MAGRQLTREERPHSKIGREKWSRTCAIRDGRPLEHAFCCRELVIAQLVIVVIHTTIFFTSEKG